MLISQDIQTRPEKAPLSLIDKDKFKKKDDIEEDLLKHSSDKSSVLDDDKISKKRKRIVSKWESVYKK